MDAVRASALAKGGGSRSFEQPAMNERPKTKRMCASLDVTACVVEVDKNKEEEQVEIRDGGSSSVSGTSLDEGRINVPLLETLKSSDV